MCSAVGVVTELYYVNLELRPILWEKSYDHSAYDAVASIQGLSFSFQADGHIRHHNLRNNNKLM